MAADLGADVLQGLPERANVPWRPRVDEAALRAAGHRWTLSILAHVVPITATGLFFLFLGFIPAVVGLILLAHAWVIPELYANRGAAVLHPRGGAGPVAERRALLLLGDLVGEDARRLHAETGLILERGALGVWLLAEAGAVLVVPGGQRVFCYCVKARAGDLPTSDQIAHLLLALRCEERDFVTVANLAFSGAPWRLGRRLDPDQRLALDAARAAAVDAAARTTATAAAQPPSQSV